MGFSPQGVRVRALPGFQKPKEQAKRKKESGLKKPKKKTKKGAAVKAEANDSEKEKERKPGIADNGDTGGCLSEKSPDALACPRCLHGADFPPVIKVVVGRSKLDYLPDPLFRLSLPPPIFPIHLPPAPTERD